DQCGQSAGLVSRDFRNRMSKDLPASLSHRHVPARQVLRLERSFAAQRFLGKLPVLAAVSSKAAADMGDMPIPSPTTCRLGPVWIGPTLSACAQILRQGSAGTRFVNARALGATGSCAMLKGQNLNNES